MHAAVVALISDTVRSIRDDLQFNYGLASDFNHEPNKKYPYVYLNPLTANPSFAVNNVYQYNKAWNVEMAFYELDRLDSVQADYKPILDELDGIVDQFINKLNGFSLEEDSQTDLVIITGIRQDSFIKAQMADILTGWLLTFTLTVPDSFNYCSIYE